MFKVMHKKFNIHYLLSAIAIINAFLLVHIGWQKYTSKGCSLCHMVPFLPITDVILAGVGAVSAVILGLFCYLSQKNNIFQIITFCISIIYASFASFLVVGQLFQSQIICYQCLYVSLGFYLIFAMLAYITIIMTIKLDQEALSSAEHMCYNYDTLYGRGLNHGAARKHEPV